MTPARRQTMATYERIPAPTRRWKSGIQEAEARAEVALRSADRPARDRGRVPQARSAAGRQEPGHVRGRGRQRRDHLPAPPGPVHRGRRSALQPADHPLALVHRPLRQLRRGDGRGARQGPGRCAAQDQDRDRGPQAACEARRSASPAPSCARATWSSARRATSSPATAT